MSILATANSEHKFTTIMTLRPQFIASLLCLALFNGCSSLPGQDATSAPGQHAAQSSADSLLQQAQKSQEPARSQLLLQAASAFYLEGRYDQARNAFHLASPEQLGGQEQQDRILLGARIYLTIGDGGRALAFLNQAEAPVFQSASPATQQELSELRASAYLLNGDPLLSAVERVSRSPMLRDAPYQRNHELIWAALTQTPTEELQHTFEQADAGDLKGWLDLALRLRQENMELEAQLQSLQAWQQDWPLHPAARQLPGELKVLAELNAQRPRRIALTLPLSGGLSSAGTAIRDGFLAAFYADPQRYSQGLEIEIFDTGTSASYLNLYQAVTASASFDMIIGPLDKSAVAELERAQDLAVPVLALNYTDTPTRHEAPLYQFGLAIEDEVTQTAQQAWQDGHRRAIIIVPDSSWGQRAQHAYTSQWQALGGSVLETARLGSNQNYSAMIRELLAVDESQRRARDISRVIGENVKSEPQRRRDVDVIFLATPPVLARQVKPLLAFHYGGDIPVYATSQVYTGITNPEKDQDLNNIRFVDTPWTLRQDNDLKAHMLDVWPDQAYDRLYALGVDAYRLAPRLEMMQRFPDSAFQGMTGALQLKEGRQIRRRLDWAEFRAGRPRALAKHTDTQ